MSEPFSLFIVDAFAERPFEGNPAAVCPLPRELGDEGWAQRLAAEMNLSETAFVGPRRPDGRRSLRWFTPAVEVDLCGHATLASAHVLWESGAEDPDTPIVFSSRSGDLPVRRLDGPSRRASRIELDFPARPPVGCDAPERLAEALGLMPLFVGRSGENDLLVEVDGVDAVTGADPDLALLGTIDARGVIVTAPVGQEDRVVVTDDGRRPDFVSRFFAPRAGVPEDPVTGSAHCALAPYWSRRLRRPSLLGHQSSRRGGFVAVEVDGDRVRLAGSAVTVLRGRLASGTDG